MLKIKQTLRKVFEIVQPFGVKKLVFVIALAVFQGLFQALSVFSLLPFLSSLGESRGSSILVRAHIELPKFIQNDQTLYLGVFALTIVLVSNILNILGDHYRSQYVFQTSQSIGIKIFSNYLFKDYTFHLKNNSSELLKRIQGDVNIFMITILMALIDSFSRVINTLFIFFVLLMISPVVSIIASFSFLLFMYLFFIFFSKKIKKGNNERKMVMSLRYLIVKEALYGIKVVQIHQSQHYLVKRANTLWKRFTDIDIFSNIASILPRYTIESIAFTCLISVIIYYRSEPAILKAIIPVIIMLVLAAYRILPNLQIVYSQITKMQSNAFVLQLIYGDLFLEVQDNFKKKAPLFKDRISIQEVSYSYPNSDRNSLDRVNLVMRQGERIGIVGTSGAGKSTLIEILTGVLNPDRGEYFIDDFRINNLFDYDLRGLYGFVPQDVFLLDDSIVSNIAFGIDSDRIDMNRVERACAIAQIKDLIENLPQGYQTICGESGARFSGGQKQRIALARALYHEPQILVLDEATSALDSETEKRFIDAIYDLPKSITIIMIAHRLSTVKSCDNIYVMDQGKVVDSGRYDYLIANSQYFKNISNAV